MQSYLQDFLRYLRASPSVYHAAKETAVRLAENDFSPLSREEKWKLEKGKSYFLVKDQTLTVAFRLPTNTPKRAQIVASHLDSPALKIRPDFSSPSDISQFGVEIYGAPLLNSWFNIDLGIAGRIVYKDGQGKIQAKCIDFRDYPLIIPQLPIHLDREVNEKGLQFNKQEHLRPIFSFSKVDFTSVLKRYFPFEEILAYDLFLYPLEEPRLIGFEHELIASYRLDNLSSAHAALWAIASAKPQEDVLSVAVFWDHEEIGSKTSSGADSFFLKDLLERIASFYHMALDDFCAFQSKSFCLSTDVAHGFHPSFSAKFDPQFTPALGKGVTLKYSAAQKYTNNALGCGYVQNIANKAGLPLQKYVARNDNPSGSTVGPLMAASLGMHTLDIGLPLLAMHAAREVVSAKDQQDLAKLLKAVLESSDPYPSENNL